MLKAPIASPKVPLVLAFLTAAAFAQQAPAPTPAPDQKGDNEPVETLKVRINVVQLFFNVKDKHGTLIPNMTKDDFEVREDSTPQTIKYFTAETNLPLTLG